MFRLVLLLFFVTIIAVAALGVVKMARDITTASTSLTQEDKMPETIQRIAYVALIILMFGVVSGWLGAS